MFPIAKKRFETNQRNCLVTVSAVLLLQPYVGGHRFTIHADLDALQLILNLAESTSIVARWWLRLMELDSDVVHRASVKHQAANTLSRIALIGKDHSPCENHIPFYAKNAHNTTNTVKDANAKSNTQTPAHQLCYS